MGKRQRSKALREMMKQKPPPTTALEKFQLKLGAVFGISIFLFMILSFSSYFLDRTMEYVIDTVNGYVFILGLFSFTCIIFSMNAEKDPEEKSNTDIIIRSLIGILMSIALIVVVPFTYHMTLQIPRAINHQFETVSGPLENVYEYKRKGTLYIEFEVEGVHFKVDGKIREKARSMSEATIIYLPYTEYVIDIVERPEGLSP